MNPLESHEPTPEFRAHLEWQIGTALRRESRLAEPVSVAAGRRRRIAAVALVALVIGGLAGMAPGYAQENKERALLLESARAEASLTQLRLQLAESEYQDAKRRVDIGVAGRETLLPAAAQLEALRTELAKTQLDMEEIRATSNAPRNDLDAPLVAGHDFVRDRLMLDLKAAQAALAAAEQEATRVQRQFDIGILPKTTVLQAQADVVRAQAEMQRLAETVRLRERALHGDLKHDDLPQAQRRLELLQQLQAAQRQLEVARARLDEASRQLAVGQAADIDVKRAELQVLEQQLELKRLEQLLAALAAVKK